MAVIVARLWPDGNGNLTVVKGYGGELKVNFLTDREVADILEDKYGLRVNIIPHGSVELACGMPLGDDVDFVWLGDSVALARYADRGCTMLRADNIYNSPVVLYSWAPVVDALVAAGVAETTADGAYTLDFAKLVDLMMAGTSWADIGLPQLHGRIVVQTTDPTRSNSGLLFAGMLANTLNGGDVVNTTTVTPLLPDIQAYFQRLGLMQPTSGDLFEQFLITGMGAKPIVALYESQIQEFLANDPSYSDQIRQQVRVLYPQPTVWATHPLVVRNENANRLLTALMDHDIQRLAWERHGQRPGVPEVVVNPEAIPVPGILPQVSSVTSMPSLGVMDQILDEIVAPPDSATPKPAAAPLAPIGVLTLARLAGAFRLAAPVRGPAGKARPARLRHRCSPAGSSRRPARLAGSRSGRGPGWHRCRGQRHGGIHRSVCPGNQVGPDPVSQIRIPSG
jgi:ABC-type Fe3+ transport system substrate-binding protein